MSIRYSEVSSPNIEVFLELLKSFYLDWHKDNFWDSITCPCSGFEMMLNNYPNFSSSFSLFSFFWYLYLSDCQSSGNWNFLLKLNLKFSVDRISSCWLGRSNFFYIFPSSCSAFLSIYLAYAFQINQLDIVLIFKQRKWQFYMD